MVFDFYYVWIGDLTADITQDCILLNIGDKCWKSGNHELVYNYQSVRRCRKLMIDSGGFNIFKHHLDYPFSVDYYHEFLEREIHPDVAVEMDYPIIDVTTSDPVKKREKTIDNFINQFDKDRTYQLMLAIQGADHTGRVNFLDHLAERFDLQKVEYFGIGGGGQWKSPGFVEGRVETIDYLNKRFNFPQIHILGFNYAALKQYIKVRGVVNFTSMDSANWYRPINHGYAYDKKGRLIPIAIGGFSIAEALGGCYNFAKQRLGEILQMQGHQPDMEVSLI
jgi:hypothetical protein